jgi:hypothetical protein
MAGPPTTRAISSGPRSCCGTKLADVTSGLIESDPMPGAVITAKLPWLTYSYPTTSNSALSTYARSNEHPAYRASYVDVGA